MGQQAGNGKPKFWHGQFPWRTRLVLLPSQVRGGFQRQQRKSWNNLGRKRPPKPSIPAISTALKGEGVLGDAGLEQIILDSCFSQLRDGLGSSQAPHETQKPPRYPQDGRERDNHWAGNRKWSGWGCLRSRCTLEVPKASTHSLEHPVEGVPAQAGWNLMVCEIPSSPNYSMVLPFRVWRVLWHLQGTKRNGNNFYTSSSYYFHPCVCSLEYFNYRTKLLLCDSHWNKEGTFLVLCGNSNVVLHVKHIYDYYLPSELTTSCA